MAQLTSRHHAQSFIYAHQQLTGRGQVYFRSAAYANRTHYHRVCRLNDPGRSSIPRLAGEISEYLRTLRSLAAHSALSEGLTLAAGQLPAARAVAQLAAGWPARTEGQVGARQERSPRPGDPQEPRVAET